MERQLFSGWAYITRAEDVPGCWVAHCYEFDIVSTGDSPAHAVDMIREAVALCIADDLNRGLDPHARRAPEDAWAPLLRLFERHTKVPVSALNGSPFREFAVPIAVMLQRVNHALEADGAADVHDAALVDAAA